MACALVLAVIAWDVLQVSEVEQRESAQSLAPDPDRKMERITDAAADRAEARADELGETLDAYLEDREVRMAVSLHDLDSGATFDYGSDELFTTASTVKVNILATLLLQAQDEGRQLTDEERGLAREMITVSGNDPANALHARIGSGAGFAEGMAEFGFTDTEPGAGGVWGVTQTSTADQVRLLRAIAGDGGPLAEESQDYIRELMGAVAPEQVWGTSAAAGPDDTVEIKNGWVPRDADGGLWAVHSLGHVYGPDRDVVIAVYSDKHPDHASGIEAIEDVVSEVMAALYPEWEPADGEAAEAAARPADDEDEEEAEEEA